MAGFFIDATSSLARPEIRFHRCRTGVAACQHQVLMGESPHISKNIGEIMRRFVSGLWIVLLLVSPFEGQANEWKQYKNADGNFTVLFPGEPQDSVNSVGGGITSHTLQARDKGVIYMVVWASTDARQTVDEANFQIFKNGFLSKLPKCEVGTEQPASPTFSGYIGHGYRLNCDAPQAKLAVTGNLYWGKHYCFALMAISASSAAEPAEMKSFMESFAIVDPSK